MRLSCKMVAFWEKRVTLDHRVVYFIPHWSLIGVHFSDIFVYLFLALSLCAICSFSECSLIAGINSVSSDR